MNDTELDKILGAWKAPEPSAALRDAVRREVPAPVRGRSYGWAAAAASVAVTAALLGVAMLGKGQAQLADGTYIQASLQAEPASAGGRWHKLERVLPAAGQRQQSFFYNRETHTYTGFDLAVDPRGDGTYIVTVQRLSRPFREVGGTADAAQYRELPLPAVPPARAVGEGEGFDIEVVRDASTGERVFERVELSHQSFEGFVEHLHNSLYRGHMHLVRFVQGLFHGSESR